MNLIWNEDPDNDVFDMAPRLGAFEISTVAQEEVKSTIEKTKTLKNKKTKKKTITKVKKVDISVLLYSKIIAKMWPLVNYMGNKMVDYCRELETAEKIGMLRTRQIV